MPRFASLLPFLFVALFLASARPAEPAAGAPWSITALPPPQLRGPTPGSALETIGPVSFTFDVPPESAQYHLQVTPIGGDGPGVDLIRNIEAPFTLPAPRLGVGPYVLLPSMTYTWRVRVSDATNPAWSDWSSEWFFTTPPASARTIHPLEPSPGATVPTLTPNLVWADDNSSVFYYEVQLSADPRFTIDPKTAIAPVYSNLVHGGESRPLNAWAVPSGYALDPGRRYYWRIRPRVQGNGTPVEWPEPSWFESASNPLPATPTPTPTLTPTPTPTFTPAPAETPTPAATAGPTRTPTPVPPQGMLLQWEVQRSSSADSLAALDAVDANVAWAAGSADTVLRTVDGGLTWERRPTATTRRPEKHDWSGVAALDKDNAVLVGELGLIMRTTDGGATWREEDSQTTVNLTSVTFIDRTTAWALGAGGLIRRSNGAGAAWTAVNAGAGEALNDITVATPLVIFLSANNGRVLKTTDGGNSWSVLNVGLDQALRGISAVNARTVWVVSPSGTVLKTSDGGADWDDVQAIRRTELAGVLALDNQTAWVTGFGGTILGTDDGGTTWVRQTTGTTGNLSRITGAEGHIWVIGSGGTILHARDSRVR